MTPDEALMILDEIASQANASRRQHLLAMEAINVLQQSQRASQQPSKDQLVAAGFTETKPDGDSQDQAGG